MRNEEKDTLMGDKNLINDSTVIGTQEKYEASNITIHNNITEDHSHTTVVCAVSGKRIYLDQSIVCPVCGKPVSPEYYVESSKRCEKCEEEAREAFRRVAAEIIGEGALNGQRKAGLDAEAKRLHIEADVQKDILRSLQKHTPTFGALTSVQEADMESAVKQLVNAASINDAKQLDIVVKRSLLTFESLRESTVNYVLDYWYYLGLATYMPKLSVQRCEEDVTDNYWQRYWAYLAYCRTDVTKASAAIERLRATFGEHEDDIKLAELSYFTLKGFRDSDDEMFSRAEGRLDSINTEYLSKSLASVLEMLKKVLANRDSLASLEMTPLDYFILTYVFGGYQAMKKQKELLDAAGKSVDGTDVPAGKDFAGFDVPVPSAVAEAKKKKASWKRTLLIVAGVLLFLIVALFLIPAPESL